MYQINDIIAGSDGYYRVVADGVKGMRLQFHRPYIAGEIVPAFGMVRPVKDAPKTHGGKKVVHVTTETDAQWWARQGELEDYRQTVDGSSYRGQ